ncbi:MAG: GNAT family N-acetyltransferase [Planctomycetes bacterium]|nr:GNAT family N-acetyltransferase [Planctomycetota bacterium]
MNTNRFGQPVGFAVHGWTEPPRPERERILGLHCSLEPLSLDTHAEALYEANTLDTDGRNWTYLAYGPFDTRVEYRRWIDASSASADPLFYAVIDRATRQALGVASYLCIRPSHGSIEVGHINFSPRLQRTPAATEAMYLMMERAFTLGYRRYEWRCDALNTPSRKAAQRLGFSFEGVFRQATIYKGRNRDTAWYSIIGDEWPALQETFTRWLDPANFTAEGKQILRLSELTRPVLKVIG